MSPWEVARLRLLGRVAGTAPRVAQVPVRQTRGPVSVPVVTAGFLAAAHRNGIAVHVWTIDEQDEMRSLLDLGVDGIMTDHADTLRDVLIERDAWVEGA